MLRLIIDTALGYMAMGISMDADILASVVIDRPVTLTTLGTKVMDFLLQTTHHDKKELEAIVVSAGPGTFTSMRAGISFAKGIGMGLEIPLVPVSTLDAMANTVKHREGNVAAAIDGKNNNIYIAEYRVEGDSAERTSPDELFKAGGDNMNRPYPVHIVGFEIERYKDALNGLYPQIQTWDRLEARRMMGALHYISYKGLYGIKPCSAVTFTPVYLRQPDIIKKSRI